MRALKFFVVLLWLAVLPWQQASAASLSARPIPAAAKKVEMTFYGSARVLVDGAVYLLVPSTQIRAQNNLITPFSHIRGAYHARVLLDASGQLHRVWLLTPEEVAAKAWKR